MTTIEIILMALFVFIITTLIFLIVFIKRLRNDITKLNDLVYKKEEIMENKHKFLKNMVLDIKNTEYETAVKAYMEQQPKDKLKKWIDRQIEFQYEEKENGHPNNYEEWRAFKKAMDEEEL